MIDIPPTSPNEKVSLPRQGRRALVLLLCPCFIFSAAFCKAESDPTLYFHWRPGADAYDTLTITVGVAVDANTPNGTYSIRSQQTTNSSNFANHIFSVTDGVATLNAFTVFSYPLMGTGPTGILLWVNDEPTSQFAGVSQTYQYTDGGYEPDYFSHHNNAQVNYIDSVVFKLDASAFGDSPIEGVQAVPEPATWIIGAATGLAVVVITRRRWSRRGIVAGETEW
jgi:hypothetical protein